MSIADKKLSVKSILIITLILPVVVIGLSSVAIIITASSAAEQKIFDMSSLEEIIYEIEEAPDSSENALKLAEMLVDDAVSSGIMKYSGRTEVNVEEINSGNENLEKILSFASTSFASHFASFYEGTSIKYGGNADGIKALLPGSDPSDFTADITDGTLTLTLSYDVIFDNMYFLDDDKASLKKFTLENNAVFSTINEKLVSEGCEYTFTADCISGRLLTMEIKRTYNYTSHISFLGTLSDIGSAAFGMKPVFTEKYDFSYAGLEIEQEYITLTKSGYQALTMWANTETGLSEDEYKLEFISSDESVATVDENGQVEAVSISEKPVTITVRLTYLGREFSDSCTVYVVNETESINISEKELTLKKGEKFIIGAEVKPDSATVKDVMYYSSDEGVAVVGADGEITAVGEGNAVISAVTVQGFLAAECAVTVEN